MSLKLLDFWNWQGNIDRGRYLATGLVLLALKHNIDRIIATSFGYPWSVFNYWVFKTPSGIESITRREASFYAELLFIALPFIWIGTVLTVRRLRDAGLPLWLVVLFFMPFLNLLFFALLVILPSAQSKEGARSLRTSRIARFIPTSEFGSAVLGIVATALLAIGLTALSANRLGNYGWGIFVGIPFLLGLNSVLIYGFHEPRSVVRCLLVALLSTGLVGIALFALAIEGVICLVMALPLAVALALIGGLIGYVLQRPAFSTQTLRVVPAMFLLVPGLTLLEYAVRETPPVYAVKTSVVINAKPEAVWSNVVSFAQLAPPTEAILKTGIAYPIRAEISGQGVGAVRHCVFSTGEFVEPITAWDEPRLLSFSVSGQPAAMEEMSIYRGLHPPHVEHYLISQRGQFALKELPDGKTLLEGTTWYQNRFWPGVYWHVWSDAIIHRIHQRVLTHIKNLAEEKSR